MTREIVAADQPPSPNDEQVAEVQALWSLDARPEFLQCSESHVYAATRGKRGVIVRMMPIAHRPHSEVAAEMEWIFFLAARGLEVAEPQKSRNEKWIEEVGTDSQRYWVSVFRRARGRAFVPEDMTVAFCRELGSYLGRCQKLTSRFVPPSQVTRRPDWEGDVGYRLASQSLDEQDQPAFELFRDMTTWMRTLSKGVSEFGLIHADLHVRNLFLDDGRITAFDFDDSCYHWFEYDLTAPMISIARLAKTADEARRLREALLFGYADEGPATIEMSRLQRFYAYRLALIYHWIKTRLQDGSMDSHRRQECQKLLPWFTEQMSSLDLDRTSANPI